MASFVQYNIGTASATMEGQLAYKAKYIINSQSEILSKYPGEDGQKLLKIIQNMVQSEP